jgi:septal ring factor EnvC (AmiA/AmiB activator)
MNVAFINPFSNAAIAKQLAAILSLVQTLKTQGVQIMADQNQLQKDVASLTDAVKQNTAALSTIGDLVKSDNDSIASLKAQIAQLQGQNPDLDLSGLEADIASLQANNATAASIATPAA